MKLKGNKRWVMNGFNAGMGNLKLKMAYKRKKRMSANNVWLCN